MLKIAKAAYDKLLHHGEADYPHECCGVLLGAVNAHTKNDHAKLVIEVVPIQNASTGDTRRHYQIAPLDLIRIERYARSTGLEILGFYHSHPDHPAHWSPTDLAEAHWLGCSYVITTVANGVAAEIRAFHLAGSGEENKHFADEEIQIEEIPFAETAAPARITNPGS